ncbi:hypothetical protein T4E_2361 [Trichinella pseudospiralis]|uniref:PiggyBac transposable element-derived protein domain-containing protein n=1 Tax=Trichinella pseudospiralis TaxID=6337 RepID=A0A0V0YLZ5_TRIPS|nr:hypothetical protein T4E_2361 [Trichinella pseudospiralis]
MYNPTKAAKYDIKVFQLSNSETYSISKMEVYVKKQNEGRNITMNNRFISYPLVEDLFKQMLTAN